MGYGPARVCQELRRRGIGRDLWEDALAQLPPAEEAIEQFLRAKCKSGAPDRAACKRLSDALLRRGIFVAGHPPGAQPSGRGAARGLMRI